MKTLKFISPLCIVMALLISSCQSYEPQALTLVPLFSDHIVLQQESDVAFWGSFTPKEKVTITSTWEEAISTKANENGEWSINLPSPKAGGPYEITISTKDSTIQIRDILVGEVWLASGQSNMEMPLSGWPPNDPIDNSDEEIANANYPAIRMFTVERNQSIEPIDTFKGEWMLCQPENAADFSATAYFFARRLHQELGIPIGIIHTSWGGTVAEAWTSNSKLASLGDFDEALKELEEDDGGKAIEAWLGSSPKTSIPNSDEAWANTDFNDAAFSTDQIDDSSWEKIPLPGRFDEMPAGEFNGAMWLRKVVEIENTSEDYQLIIGAVDDMDQTYVNGQQVGGMTGAGHWNTPRNYTISKDILNEGSNLVAIKAIDTGGPGVITGSIYLLSASGDTIHLKGDWKRRPVAEIYSNQFYLYDGTKDMSKRPNIFRLHPNTPTVLFNAMIKPLIPYTVKGAIWYQGESNVGRASQYTRLFPAMIEDWRQRWNNDFPFYFVQIAPFKYDAEENPETDRSQKLRDAQRRSLSLENTGMVVTMDIGNYINIHPGNKQDVGSRLAGLALANDYDKDLIASGPLFIGAAKEGNTLILEFESKGSGLVGVESGLIGFEIAGADKKYVTAEAEIVDNKIKVSSESIEDPMHVRYAWSNNGIATLFNKEGLPASSFSSEELRD